MPDAEFEQPADRQQRSRRWKIAISTAGLLALALSGWWFAARPSSDELLAQAQRAQAQGDYSNSIRLATKAMEQSPDSDNALLIAARSATSLSELNQALGYYDRISNDGSETAAIALAEAGELLLFKMYRATDAEDRFRSLLNRHAKNPKAINRLVYLYSTEGRTAECVEMLSRQIQSKTFTIDHLLMIGQRSPFVESPSVISTWLEADPNDVVPLISIARIAATRNQLLDAEKTLRNVLSKSPMQIEATALLGLVLLEADDKDKFIDWHHSVLPETETHPMVWLVRGHWARRRGENSTAVRCYWESLKREPQQKAAAYQLGQTLLAVDQPDRARIFLDHAASLEKLNRELNHLVTHQQDFEVARSVAAQLESMGRLWEAWGWSQWVVSTRPHVVWAAEMIARLAPQLREGIPLTVPSHHPGLQFDWSLYPLPEWKQSISSETKSVPGVSDGSVTFTDATATAGIDFAYFNGCEKQQTDRRIHEQMGGGIAVVDFDKDNWPDLYFTQGSTWPPAAGQEYVDHLFRNRGDGAFNDVTSSCLTSEEGYSQGVTVGDLDSDGFPDLYVANIGANRLYQNNGDGTFSDVTPSEIEGNDWTTSCVLADLNGDAHPDLYAVNYVVGENVYSKICRDSEGRSRICSPAEFSPASDRLYTSFGDGSFTETASWTSNPVNTGNGLGIVAADFDSSGFLSLFVANDQTANFFLRNRTKKRGNEILLVDDALIAGLAYDQDGLSQACMGVAADDADGDGKLDLFVTNFSNESNVLYLQQNDGFLDATRRAGLRTASFAMLGFGTQFLDGELDGFPDLVVTNGHVDRSGRDGVPYQMHPQYFHNAGGCRFFEQPRQVSGSYFQTKHVGRSLARLDWNRDGREEFAVSHLETPATLMRNDTPNTGHYIGLRLTGVISSRDAIGTSVTVTTNSYQRTRQLTAGDGYQASNQRLLIFGLAESEIANRIELDWPSGLKQTFDSIHSGADYMIVEGHDQVFRLPE
ncbi:MAG: VCBS repeat-containing protein [Rhodopirellula sp.]|nr:VCBS repeat-containing protein [Rhodopirellula sp.]